MSYELAILQNYSSEEHNFVNSRNLSGFYSIKKTLWNLFSVDDIVSYEGTKPNIEDIDKFENICGIIEKRYIDKCITFLFK